jgi:hypothetical protein
MSLDSKSSNRSSRSASNSRSKSRSNSRSRSISTSDNRTSSTSSESSRNNKASIDLGNFFDNNRERKESSLELQKVFGDIKDYGERKNDDDDDDEEIDDLSEYLNDELEKLEKLSQSPIIINMNSSCIRNVANWSKVEPHQKIDHADFDPEKVKSDIQKYSPKLDALIKNINKLDEEDMRNHGRKFKHFIFSDIKNNNGAKAIAAGFIANGYKIGMKAVPVGSTQKNKSPQNKTDKENSGEKQKTKYKLALLSDDELLKNKGDNFYLLSSVALFDQPLRVDMKKAILKKFNQRPDNVYGNYARLIIMDSGFKEGIDLFDIKYVHIYEPQTTMADQKQVIGRGTRTCGQKGLKFHPKYGWPLHVYKYDLEIPEKYRNQFLMSKSAFDLYLKSKNIDIRLFNLNEDMEKTVIYGSVDYELNKNVHDFSVNEENSMENMAGGAIVRRHQALRDYIKKNYGQFSWDKVKMENLCGYEGPESMRSKGGDPETSDFGIHGGATNIKFSPTQDFIRNYFLPSLPLKGMLLYQSVGTGKTCTAIATATTQFEPAGYTILWVTRTTLKNDIWKNMFEQICHEQIRQEVERGVVIPDIQAKRMKMLSKAWSIRPMSYKQFSNLVSKKNALYKSLVKKNGAEDPLRKTLLIIDEAHKLFGGNDLSSIERPDTDALHSSLMNSYVVSGQDSVRLMLMTATPITQDPMEIIKLLNLCKLPDRQIPCMMETFSAQYLDEDGRFTPTGKANFLDQIAGHVSYLNREGDARQFSRPIIHDINVPIVNSRMESLIQKYDKEHAKSGFTETLKKIQEEMEEKKKKLSNNITAKKLDFMMKRCETIKTKKLKTACSKVVREHKKQILNDLKSVKSVAKEELKAIKDEIKNLNVTQKAKLYSMGKPDKEDQDYKDFNNSAYYRLKHDCIGKIPDASEQKKALENHPIAISIKRGLDVIEQKKKDMEQLKKDHEVYGKNRILNIRNMMKEHTSELEQSVLKLTMNDLKDKLAVERININRKVAKDGKILDTLSKTFKRKQKKIIANLRKTAKKKYRDMLKIKNQENKEKKKLEKMEEKIENVDDINDKLIRDIVTEHTNMMDSELAHILEDDAKAAEADAEKEAKKAHKEHEMAEKKANKLAKDAEKIETKAAKEAEKKAKAEAKEAEKLAKEAEKQRKLAEKEAEKAHKERVKADKLANKTAK